MRSEDRRRRRDTFLGDAADYAAVRPPYPDRVLEEAEALSGLTPGARVLEIGCGTGLATVWFARRGYRILALDRSEPMVRFATFELARFGGVQVRLADFEEIPAAPTFTALVFATSFHWLDPSDRVERCASHLSARGALILLWHTHPPPYTGFFDRVQRIYERLVPGWKPPPSPGMALERIEAVRAELERDGVFGPAARRTVVWSRTLPRVDYLRLLCTYSDHALLDDGQRAQLLDEVGALIDREYGGVVERPYSTELIVARRR